MVIAIDGNEANQNVRVGIGEYAYELLWHFSKLADEETSFNIYLKDKPGKFMPSENKYFTYRVFRTKKYWTQFALPLNLYLKKNKPDIFFTPSHYAPRFSPVKCAISIMDLSYIFFPELFRSSDLYQLKNWTYYSVKKSRVIFTISQHSKNDIINYYKVEPKRVVV